MTFWQPIETAPKDEIVLIVFICSCSQEVALGSHAFGDNWEVRDRDYDDTVCPTHWMPLPEPPK
jgi:hypothetical protein